MHMHTNFQRLKAQAMQPSLHPAPAPAAPPAFTIPAPVGAALSLLPAYPGSMLLVAAINLALARHLPDDVTALLQGKRLAIRVRDARLNFDFTWQGGRFVPCAAQAETDLAISANAQDFVLLAQRKQDPDTLFSTAAWSWRATPSWAWW